MAEGPEALHHLQQPSLPGAPTSLSPQQQKNLLQHVWSLQNQVYQLQSQLPQHSTRSQMQAMMLRMSQSRPMMTSHGQPSLMMSQGQPLMMSHGQPSMMSHGQPSMMMSQGQPLMSQGQPLMMSQGQLAIMSQGQPATMSQGQPAMMSQGQPAMMSRGQPPILSHEQQSQSPLQAMSPLPRQPESQPQSIAPLPKQPESQPQSQLSSQMNPRQLQTLSQNQPQMTSQGQQQSRAQPQMMAHLLTEPQPQPEVGRQSQLQAGLTQARSSPPGVPAANPATASAVSSTSGGAGSPLLLTMLRSTKPAPAQANVPAATSQPLSPEASSSGPPAGLFGNQASQPPLSGLFGKGGLGGVSSSDSPLSAPASLSTGSSQPATTSISGSSSQHSLLGQSIPPSDKPESVPRPLSDMFKPKSGAWGCPGCYSQQSPDTTTCPACGTRKPGSAKEEGSPSGEQRPSAASFVPVSSLASGQTNTSTAGFSLSGMPTLGTSGLSSEQKPTTGGFKLGEGGFKLGEGGFKLGGGGINTGTSQPAAANIAQPSSQQPLFGQRIPPSFGNVPAQPTVSSMASSASGLQAASSAAPGGIKPLAGFASSLASMQASKTASVATDQEVVTPGFFANVLSESSSPKKQSQDDDADDDNGGNDGDDVNQSDDQGPYFEPVVNLKEVETKTGEENDDTLFAGKAKLYRFAADKTWKERGEGEMRLLRNKSNGTMRALMRREVILKVCANHLITANMELKPFPNRKNSWIWFTPADMSDDGPTPETFAIKFKSDELSGKFNGVFMSCVAKMKSPTAASPQLWTDESSDAVGQQTPAGANPEEAAAESLPSSNGTPPSAVPQLEFARSVSSSDSQPRNGGQPMLSIPKDATASVLTTTSQQMPVRAGLGGWRCVSCMAENRPEAVRCAECFVDRPHLAQEPVEQATDTSDSVEFVYERNPTPEKIALAEKFQLPKTFYLYESKPPCPGCRGCGDDPELPPLSSAGTNSPPAADTRPEATSFVTQAASATSTSPPRVDSTSAASSSAGGFGSFTGGVSFSDIAKQSGSSSGGGWKTSEGNFSFAGAGRQVFGGGGDEDDEGDADDNYDPYYKPIMHLDLCETRSGEENDEILHRVQRCKLFRFHEKEWKERGVGEAKLLKDKTTGRIRFLMRREMVMKVCANHVVQPDMVLTPAVGSDRAWTWFTPADYTDEEPRPEKLCLKFKNAELANEFKLAFEECVTLVVAAAATAANRLADKISSSPCEDESVGDVAETGQVTSAEVASGDKPESSPRPLSELFKLKSGTWECPDCCSQQSPDTTTCPACGARKPGSAKEEGSAAEEQKSFTASFVPVSSLASGQTNTSTAGFSMPGMPTLGTAARSSEEQPTTGRFKPGEGGIKLDEGGGIKLGEGGFKLGEGGFKLGEGIKLGLPKQSSSARDLSESGGGAEAGGFKLGAGLRFKLGDGVQYGSWPQLNTNDKADKAASLAGETATTSTPAKESPGSLFTGGLHFGTTPPNKGEQPSAALSATQTTSATAPTSSGGMSLAAGQSSNPSQSAPSFAEGSSFTFAKQV